MAVIVEPRGVEKMSEVLEEFAAPLLAHVEDDESYRSAIAVAAIAWNLSIFPEAEQQTLFSEETPEWKNMEPAARREFKVILDDLVQRKNKHFADIDRLIIDYELTDTAYGFQLDVMSTIPEAWQRSAGKSLLM